MNNEIKGVVLCICGDQIISNSGKVIYNYKTNKLKCWGCGIEFDSDFCYSQRKENEIIIINIDSENCPICLNQSDACEYHAKKIHESWHKIGFNHIRPEMCHENCPGVKK
jgi:hypothetical protein